MVCPTAVFRGVLKKAAVPSPELPAFVAEATSAE